MGDSFCGGDGRHGGVQGIRCAAAEEQTKAERQKNIYFHLIGSRGVCFAVFYHKYEGFSTLFTLTEGQGNGKIPISPYRVERKE